MKKSYTFLLALAAMAACQQQPQQSLTPETTQTGINKFADPMLRELYTLQDERKTTELLNFLNHPKASYRQEAAMAFASVQDTLAIPQLLASLSDTTAGIRLAS